MKIIHLVLYVCILTSSALYGMEFDESFEHSQLPEYIDPIDSQYLPDEEQQFLLARIETPQTTNFSWKDSIALEHHNAVACNDTSVVIGCSNKLFEINLDRHNSKFTGVRNNIDSITLDPCDGSIWYGRNKTNRTCLTASSNLFAYVLENKTICLINQIERNETMFKELDHIINALAFNDDESLLASGGYEIINLWKLEDKSLLRTFNKTHFDVHSMIFTKNNSIIACGENQYNEIEIWDSNHNIQRTFTGYISWFGSPEHIHSMITPSTKHLTLVCFDKLDPCRLRIIAWDIEKMMLFLQKLNMNTFEADELRAFKRKIHNTSLTEPDYALLARYGINRSRWCTIQ